MAIHSRSRNNATNTPLSTLTHVHCHAYLFKFIFHSLHELQFSKLFTLLQCYFNLRSPRLQFLQFYSCTYPFPARSKNQCFRFKFSRILSFFFTGYPSSQCTHRHSIAASNYLTRRNLIPLFNVPSFFTSKRSIKIEAEGRRNTRVQ